jgi:hypothetical protein
MKWTYLLLFDGEFMSYDEAKYFLNARDDISEWTHVFGCFFLFVSDNDGESLGAAVLAYGQKNQGTQKPNGFCLVMEVHNDRQGWLPTIAWNMMNYKSTQAPEPAKPAKALPGGTDALDEEEIPF